MGLHNYPTSSWYAKLGAFVVLVLIVAPCEGVQRLDNWCYERGLASGKAFRRLLARLR